jgi:hypothetical protein
LAEPVESEIVLGDAKQSGGVFIDPMNDARANEVILVGQRILMVDQGVHQGAGPMPVARMDDEASRFIDDEDIIVLIDDI